MMASRTWSWREWSRRGWTRHLPEIPDHEQFVAALGEATIHGLAHGIASGASWGAVLLAIGWLLLAGIFGLSNA